MNSQFYSPLFWAGKKHTESRCLTVWRESGSPGVYVSLFLPPSLPPDITAEPPGVGGSHRCAVSQEHCFGFNQAPSTGRKWSKESHETLQSRSRSFVVQGSQSSFVVREKPVQWNDDPRRSGLAWEPQLHSVSESEQKTKDTNSLCISDFKFICFEKCFAQLWYSSQDLHGPANGPALGFLAPAGICTTHRSPLEEKVA